MKVLLLAALVSQVVGKPQQGYYQPGNTWSNTARPTQWTPSGHQRQQPGNTWINTRPAQPTQWSAWSSVEVGAPSSYNSYDSYNSYNPYNPYIPNNPYNPYNPHNPYDYDVPGSGGDFNSVSGSVGGPFIQDIGLDQQGFLDQGWNNPREWPSQNPEQRASPCESTVCWPSVRGTNAGIVRPWSLRGRFRHRSRNYG